MLDVLKELWIPSVDVLLVFQVGFEMMDRELLWHGFAVSIVQQYYNHCMQG